MLLWCRLVLQIIFPISEKCGGHGDSEVLYWLDVASWRDVRLCYSRINLLDSLNGHGRYNKGQRQGAQIYLPLRQHPDVHLD